ncbi:MAG: alpha/beta hydrolase [Alphaproteobacteria bacterium]|nr:alpha/beta hydrolase [Alphaproteobacteria bacterium]
MSAAPSQFDPVIARLLKVFEASRERPFDVANIAQIRERFSGNARDRTVDPSVSVEDVRVNGVPVRLYRPKSDGPLPLHVHYHGGGFVLGSALSGEADGLLSRRAAGAGCVVASVEYRLAPEHPFPAGIEDSYAALIGLAARAGEMRFAASAISIGGISSGGNFAAVVAQMARGPGRPKLALQLLEIAGTDLTKSSAAWRTFRPGHDTTRERDLALCDLYVPRESRAHPMASPLFAPDLTGLAPAYVMNAEFDPRRDECEAYVVRLQDAGVPALARTIPGHVHGSMSMTGWPPADAWQAEAIRAIRLAHECSLAGKPFNPELVSK